MFQCVCFDNFQKFSNFSRKIFAFVRQIFWQTEDFRFCFCAFCSSCLDRIIDFEFLWNRDFFNSLSRFPVDLFFEIATFFSFSSNFFFLLRFRVVFAIFFLCVDFANSSIIVFRKFFKRNFAFFSNFQLF